MGSRGSVIPFFLSLKDRNSFPITDKTMTRFMISLEEGIKLVWKAFDDMHGGEIYVKKIPSILVTDIAKAINEKAKLKLIGIRPGEKLHEQMIGSEDAPYTYEYLDYYKILPMINNWNKDKKRIGSGKKVKDNFIYSSLNNKDWMTTTFLKKWIRKNINDIGFI
jgi:FlaA1/EpsC-like NDP-sugar epimerase